MANETERLLLEMGRNERWQDKIGGAFPTISENSLPFALGRAVKRRAYGTARYRRTIDASRKRLDPKNY